MSQPLSEFMCFWHHEVEPIEGAYQECFECKHVFQTEEELITEHNKHYPDEKDVLARVTRGTEVFCCPLCTHDW